MPFKSIVSKLFSPKIDRFLRAAAIPATDKGTQLLLSLQYRETAISVLSEAGFRAFSQFDEDGILLYIFTVIGTTSKKCVEICVGNGIECNTANLVINFGWHALMFDGSLQNIEQARLFYSLQSQLMHNQPKLVHAWLDTDNTKKLVDENGFSGEVDLLSIDLDGADYWIWKSLDNINPRVVVAEYNGGLGTESVTVPYNQKLMTSQIVPGGFEGAALGALTKLAESRGYRLVGCNVCDLNAFFVRNDLGLDRLPEIDIESCLTHPRSKDKHRRETLAKLDWERV